MRCVTPPAGGAVVAIMPRMVMVRGIAARPVAHCLERRVPIRRRPAGLARSLQSRPPLVRRRHQCRCSIQNRQDEHVWLHHLQSTAGPWSGSLGERARSRQQEGRARRTPTSMSADPSDRGPGNRIAKWNRIESGPPSGRAPTSRWRGGSPNLWVSSGPAFSCIMSNPNESDAVWFVSVEIRG